MLPHLEVNHHFFLVVVVVVVVFHPPSSSSLSSSPSLSAEMESSLQPQPTSPTARHTPPSITVAGGAQYIEYNDARSPPPPQSEATTPFEDSQLLPRSPPADAQRSSSRIFPSPLNPTPPVTNPFTRSSSTSSRPVSRSSSTHPFTFSKFRDEGRSPGSHFSPSTMAGLGLGVASSGLPSTLGPRGGSMVLYRLADDPATQRASLLPPKFSSRCNSMVSSSGDSVVSLQSDSKYPSEISTIRGLVPYAYDPALDEMGPPDAEDYLHDPKSKGGFKGDKGEFPWRGILNVAVLLLLVLGLLILFIFYPVLTFYRNAARNNAIDGNIRINATGASSLSSAAFVAYSFAGQSPVLFQMPEIIDAETPASARTHTGTDGSQYELVFSDEFTLDGRTFYPGESYNFLLSF